MLIFAQRLLFWGYPVVSVRVSGFLVLLAGMLSGTLAFAQFETRAVFGIPNAEPNSLLLGDFNRDGVLDVAVLNTLPSGSVQILLGKGDGTFRPGDTYPVAAAFYGATASLRHNGILDIVLGTAGSSNVNVMLGNGDGTFQPAVPYPTTAQSHMIGLGDFTGGGKVDIIDLEGTSNQGTICNCVEVLPGNGDGTFGPPIATIPVPYNIDGFSIASGDFNNDGKLDIAIGGGYFSTSQVDILLGNGDGTFTPNGYYPLVSDPGSIATGYFTGDRTKLDLALTSGPLAVLLGNGDGTFEQAVYYEAQSPSWVIAKDLDGDGVVDLVASDSGEVLKQPPGVSVLKGSGDGTFGPAQLFVAGSRTDVSYVAAGDFNNDGKPDLALVDEVGSQIITLLNTGSATFSPTSPLTFSGRLLGTTSAPLTVTLTNSGVEPLTVSSVQCSGAPFRMTENTCVDSLASGAQCAITANFTANATGIVGGTITINDSASSKRQVVELIGIATELGISPAKLLFPPQKVGTQSAPRAIHLTNAGKTSLSITSIGMGGIGAVDFPESNNCGSSLEPKSGCTITVTFAPQHAGMHSAWIQIDNNGGNSPNQVPLSGRGD